MQDLKKKIEFNPTPDQWNILEGLKRITVTCGARRCGKTLLASYLLLRELLASNREIWSLSPQFTLSKAIYKNLQYWINRYFPNVFKFNESELRITNLVTGSILTCKSAENPVGIRGQGLSLLVIDEAQLINEDVFNIVRPNVAENRPELGGDRGRMFIIGNPSPPGHWFHKLFISEEYKDKSAFFIPLAVEDDDGNIIKTSNPIVSIEELIELKHTTPEYRWRTEYLGQWLDAESALFANVEECATGELTGPQGARFYYIGVDLGRLKDSTVITVVDQSTLNVVHWERFSGIEWPFQKKKIVEVVRKYGVTNSQLIVDQTGLGQPIVDDLLRAEINVMGITFTSKTKKDIIEKLAIMLEHKQISYPDLPILKEELKVFAYAVSEKTGRVSFGAPAGYHDDAVISLALAMWKCPSARTVTTKENPVDNRISFSNMEKRRKQDEETGRSAGPGREFRL